MEDILGVAFDQEGKEDIREGRGRGDSQVGRGREGPLRVFGNFGAGQVEKLERVGRVGWCWNGLCWSGWYWIESKECQ